MRRPTTREEAYRWHKETLAAKKAGTKPPPIHENDPKCGWYMRRLVPKGEFVPCKIWMVSPTDPATGELTGPEVLLCEVGGRRQDVGAAWTWLASRPISEDDYMDMLAGSFRQPQEAPRPAAPAPDPVAQEVYPLESVPEAPITTTVKTAF